MQDLRLVIEEAVGADLPWDFYEDGDEVAERAWQTVPGRIVAHLLASPPGWETAERIIGLLTAFAARRSLACWFAYCEEELPLSIAERLVEKWLPPQEGRGAVEEAWLVETPPRENGIAITDCRRSDTGAASSAVAHAARFAKARVALDAITSLSHAFIAFDATGRGRRFVEWLVGYAAPAAREGRALSAEEQFALADFAIPPVMRARAEASD